MNAYQPPKKLQQPRGRRSYSVSGQVVTSEQPLDSNKSKEIKKSKQSPSPTTRSRIPRLSISFKGKGQQLLKRYLKIEPPRNIRSSPSRPIINTALITDVEVGSESPTGRSPTIIHHQKYISYDDVVIPTIAKKLKMNGQLPYVNHDALLGYSDEPEDLTPTSENGPDSQHRRQRKNSSSGHSRNASKTHYIAPRKQPPSTDSVS
ncbi:unnamed protein product [Rhizophagus irregularis]|nr:unnamed protein product [Rhizophagus irregularis]